MARAPIAEPSLDQAELVELIDPVPATIGHLQRVDRWTHATYTAYGGAGFWVPMHMDQSETPDDMVFSLPIPAGVEYFRIRGYASQRNKTTPKRCDLVLASANTATSIKLTWQEVSGGNTLVGALELASSDDTSAEDGPLRCVVGTSWSRGWDTITATFDEGTGIVWGLLFQPIHTPR